MPNLDLLSPVPFYHFPNWVVPGVLIGHGLEALGAVGHGADHSLLPTIDPPYCPLAFPLPFSIPCEQTLP